MDVAWNADAVNFAREREDIQPGVEKRTPRFI
jgi:hypothetical protein